MPGIAYISSTTASSRTEPAAIVPDVGNITKDDIASVEPQRPELTSTLFSPVPATRRTLLCERVDKASGNRYSSFVHSVASSVVNTKESWSMYLAALVELDAPDR